jgi:ATP-binding cassette subfamily F protein 2
VSHDFRMFPSHIVLDGMLITVGRIGLISQVAEDLWEVKDKTVMNLTKQEITIVDYKRSLAKRSESSHHDL